MKEKILAALKTKYASKGFSAKTLEGLAEQLVPTIKEEADIQAAVDGLEGMLNLMQAETDRRVTDAVAKEKIEAEKNKNTPPATPPATPPKTEENKDEVPAWAQAIIDAHKQTQEQLAAINGEKTRSAQRKQLESKLEKVNLKYKESKLKDFDRMKFETEEAFNEYLTEVETDAKEFAQEEANTSLSQFGKPGQSTNLSGKATDEEVAKITEQINI